MPFRAEAVEEGLVEVAGELDVASAPALEACLSLAMPSAPGRRLVLDVHAVTFCDSRGLAALIQASRSLPPGGALVLRGVQPFLERLLSIAGLDTVFEVQLAEPGAS